MTRLFLFFALFLSLITACKGPKAVTSLPDAPAPFYWGNATVYFLLTDRFQNGNPGNDVNFERDQPCAPARGFMGGDIAGITQYIRSGYFDSLGVNAIWLTPVVEQIHDQVDEGSGKTYGFHGYWAKDWTALDPNFGTEKDFAAMVEAAHSRGIRVVLDVVINHTGPATEKDPLWPADWVRSGPKCTYTNYATTTACTLVDNLPDIKTESAAAVGLPLQLTEKWRSEGRLERETAELDAFFARTGYPRTPHRYIIKWLTDFIRKYGIDGFRCDTAKHLEEGVWAELRKEADLAFADWKRANPAKKLDDQPFYMVAEVYGYNIAGGRDYDFGDRKVDYFANGFTSLINFGAKYDAKLPYEQMFARYDTLLRGPLKGVTVLNYLASHDDGSPYDPDREMALEAGTRLLLCPGQAQIYYGDETARTLTFPGAQGDANLRAFMNWDELASNQARGGHFIQDVLLHWRRLGSFRSKHPAVGMGVHQMLNEKPYVFKRSFKNGTYQDAVVIGLDLPSGRKTIPVGNAFPEGAVVMDYYSGQTVVVQGGAATFTSGFTIALLGK